MKLLSILVLILTLFIHNSHADNNLEFENWKKTFKAVALKNNISENTFNLVMSDVKFLPKVIEYDRYQPCLLYTSPSPRDGLLSRMPSSA